MFLSALVIVLGFLQAQVIPAEYFDTRKGLSNNIIYDVYQDKKGFIWVGTENGLNKFDGYEFEVFHHDGSDSATIASNVVRTITEDKYGRIWVGTFEGLSLYNPNKKSFRNYSFSRNGEMGSLDVQHIYKASNGNFWFLTNEGITRFDIESKEFELLPFDQQIVTMVLDNNDQLWITTNQNELFIYDINDRSFKESGLALESPSSAIFLNKSGSIIFGFSEVVGNSKWQRLKPAPKQFNTLKLLEDKTGKIWVGSDSNFWIYDMLTGDYSEVTIEGADNSLTQNIKSISEDKSGGIWIGTLNGLFYLDNQRKPFYSLPKKGMVMGVEVENDNLWVNYFSEGITKWANDGTGKKLPETNWSLFPGSNQIWDIEKDKDSGFLLATTAGLMQWNSKSRNLIKIELPKEEGTDPVVFLIKKIGTDFWVTGKNTIYKISPDENYTVTDFHLDGKYLKPLLQDLEVFDGDTLIASEGNGIFNFNNGNPVKWSKMIDIQPELINSSIWDLFVSEKGILWIAGNMGLCGYSRDSGFKTYKLDENENQIVFSITEDKQGSLWLGTDKGIAKFDPDTETSIFFDEIDGIESQEFNRRSVANSGNSVYMGGMGGLVWFDPSLIQSNTTKPDVWITEINVIKPDSSNYMEITDQSEMELDWEENSLEIDFVALSYSNPRQNQYRYKLEGYDPDWVKDGDTRKARYVQLPAGEYTFKVIASNNDGVWNEVGDEFRIIIKPPFWQTIWFRLLILIAILATGMALYRYRVRQLLEVERVKLRIAGDLHDEIGSGLSGIALSGDILQSHAESGELKPEIIRRITDNARNLASSLDAIVWLIDPNKEKISDLIQKCKSVGSEMLLKHKLIFKEEISEISKVKKIDSQFRRNVYLIIKEVIHNIYKHAEAATVEIFFKLTDSMLVIEIKDDGKGFSEELVEKGNGLANLKRRAEEIRGGLTITSTPGSGTTISLKVRLP